MKLVPVLIEVVGIEVAGVIDDLQVADVLEEQRVVRLIKLPRVAVIILVTRCLVYRSGTVTTNIVASFGNAAASGWNGLDG